MRRIVKQFTARPRTFVALAVMSATLAMLPGTWPWTTRLLMAWDLGALLYLGAVTLMMARADHDAMRRRASREDEGAVTVLLLTSLAASASFVAIVVELAGLGQVSPLGKTLHLTLAVVTILCSWFLVHITFALHYAHEYYGEGGDGQRGGLKLPGGGHEPDYWDFLYFSFNLGAAAQTSDISITSRVVRRVVLAHTILSFLFNTTILALGINVAASLMSGS